MVTRTPWQPTDTAQMGLGAAMLIAASMCAIAVAAWALAEDGAQAAPATMDLDQDVLVDSALAYGGSTQDGWLDLFVQSRPGAETIDLGEARALVFVHGLRHALDMESAAGPAAFEVETLRDPDGSMAQLALSGGDLARIRLDLSSLEHPVQPDDAVKVVLLFDEAQAVWIDVQWPSDLVPGEPQELLRPDRLEGTA